MEKKLEPSTPITILMLISILIPASANSRMLATSPSLAPEVKGEHKLYKLDMLEERNEKATSRGSFPVICHSKCNQCKPCRAVEILIKATGLEENEYYPQVWRCMCEDKLFSP